MNPPNPFWIRHCCAMRCCFWKNLASSGNWTRDSVINWNQMSRVPRTPVFGVCDQVRLKPACSATGTNQGLEIVDRASIYIILSKQRTTKALIRLSGRAGWSALLLFAYGINRFSHDVAQIYIYRTKSFNINICFWSMLKIMLKQGTLSHTLCSYLSLYSKLHFRDLLKYVRFYPWYVLLIPDWQYYHKVDVESSYWQEPIKIADKSVHLLCPWRLSLMYYCTVAHITNWLPVFYDRRLTVLSYGCTYQTITCSTDTDRIN